MPLAATDICDKLALGFADSKSYRRSYPLRDDKARTTVEDTHVDAPLVEPITHGRRKGAMVGGLLWRPLTLRPSPSHPGRPAAGRARGRGVARTTAHTRLPCMSPCAGALLAPGHAGLVPSSG